MSSTEIKELDGQIEGFKTVCEQAARLGGAELLSWVGRFKISEKGPGDLVTQADLASQKAIEEFVAQEFPDFRFVGEEDNVAPAAAEGESEFCWVVDPLDGTTNYCHQLPSYSVSVGLRYRDRIVAGCVFDPWLKECYSAGLGLGASLNGQPIQTSTCTEISKSLLVCSFSGGVRRTSEEIERFLRILDAAQSIRRLGSAAQNLCYVDNGRLDGYWASSLSLWDIAAGVLILQEAGGAIRHIDGGELNLDDPRFVASAGEKLQGELEACIRG